MRTTCLLALGCVIVAVAAYPQSQMGNGAQIGYELYSWKEANGDWSFSVLYTTSIQKTVKQVLDDKTALHGLDQLKAKVDALPRGARVSWLGRIPVSTGPRAKGSERLGYPPVDVIQDVRRHAEKRNIKIVIHGSPDALP